MKIGGQKAHTAVPSMTRVDSYPRVCIGRRTKACCPVTRVDTNSTDRPTSMVPAALWLKRSDWDPRYNICGQSGSASLVVLRSPGAIRTRRIHRHMFDAVAWYSRRDGFDTRSSRCRRVGTKILQGRSPTHPDGAFDPLIENPDQGRRAPTGASVGSGQRLESDVPSRSVSEASRNSARNLLGLRADCRPPVGRAGVTSASKGCFAPI